ncbi:MAG: hypothetical protein L7S67_00715 [Flavobacteriales bacterium]|nr:hypothetical protein [Flavobacteriales bacterium]
MRRAPAFWAGLLCVMGGLSWTSCATLSEPETALDSACHFPAGTSLPGLTAGPDGPALLFTEVSGDTVAVRWAKWSATGWQDTVTIATGTDVLVNWADRPGLAFDGAGGGHAHWLVMDPRGDFCYGIETAHSQDGGRTWSAPDRPHRDTAVAEHGFGQWMVGGDGALFAWLDGRHFDGHPNPAKAPMEVRAARWTAAKGWSKETVLDSSACTCCPLATAPAGAAHLLTYRDRTAEEIRDFSEVLVGSDSAGMAALQTGPAPIGADGWQVAGCPVNGSALAAGTERTLAVWFTNAGDVPRIRSAWRTDGGAWSAITDLQQHQAVGRVAAAVDGRGHFHAAWMERIDEKPRLMGQCWNPQGNALLPAPVVLQEVDDARAGGFPTMTGLAGPGVMLAWTTTGKEAHVRSATWTPSP